MGLCQANGPISPAGCTEPPLPAPWAAEVIRLMIEILRAPRDHINTRLLRSTVSSIPLVLGLFTRIQDPYVYVVWKGPECCMASYTKTVGILVVFAIYSMYWVMQDFYPQQ